MIHIVATKVKSGKGGISTALVGFCEATILKRDGINIIESHSGETSKLANFCQAARRIKDEVKAGDIAWLHCARWFSMLRKYLLARKAKKRGAIIVFHFHSAVTDDYLRSPWRRWLMKRMVKIADGVCVLTPWWQKRMIEQLELPSAKVHVVPNTLDSSFMHSGHVHDIQPCKPIKLLCMTRLVAGKNVDAVIHSLAALPPNYTLSIAGDGPETDRLEALAKRLNLQNRIQFLGWVDYYAKLSLLEQHHLFVLPSQFDAFGMGFIEAMAIGLPVIALAHGATPDIVRHQQTGFLAADCSTSALVQAITYCTEHHRALSKAARQHVRDHFAVEPVALKLLEFFAVLKQLKHN